MTVIYIDSLFVLNLIINYLLLLLTAKLTGLPFKRRRLLAGAALGALYAALTVLPGLQWLSFVLVKCAVSVPVTAAAFGLRRGFLRALLLFWISGFLLAGLVLGLNLLFGRPSNGVPYAPVSLRALLLTAAAAYFVLTVTMKGFARHGGRRSQIVSVRVSYRGRNTDFSALVDTGHTLTDPTTGQPVLVADLPCVAPLLPREIRGLVTAESLRNPIELLEQLRLLDSGLMLRLIPYHAIGTQRGLLLAFRPDSVTVGGRGRETLLIGLSPTALSDGKPYAALVGV